MSKLNQYDIGCIVGRFQVPELHQGHIKLIDEVCRRHDNKVIIFVGVSPVLGTKENPLDFKTRKEMIEYSFHGIVVLPLPDMRSDEVWSRNLDNQIRTVYPLGKVCLYGGRDSFLKSYCGGNEACEFPTHDYRPGSEIRKEIGRLTLNSAIFRSGIIYSTQNQYKRTHLTIDVAIYKKNGKALEILLGKKHNENKLRFIGGFVEGETLEESVRREAQEEAGVALEGPLEFIGSHLVDDWRYRGTSDSILTNFFASEITWGGHTKAGDDIELVQLININDLANYKEIMVKSHHPLAEMALKYFKGK